MALETQVNVSYDMGVGAPFVPGSLSYANSPPRNAQLNSAEDLQRLLRESCQRHRFSTDRKHCVAIDGNSVVWLAADETCKELFFELCSRTAACICCRLAPKQKAFLVSFVQQNFKNSPITLAIGDGANDVAMIQEARVGIGTSCAELVLG